jgi:hypothetical protein
LGRSRGGLTTTLHLARGGRGRPLAVVATAGRCHGRTQLEAALDGIRAPRPGRGQPCRLPERLVADRGYGSRYCRTLLRRRGVPRIHPADHPRAARPAAATSRATRLPPPGRRRAADADPDMTWSLAPALRGTVSRAVLATSLINQSLGCSTLQVSARLGRSQVSCAAAWGSPAEPRAARLPPAIAGDRPRGAPPARRRPSVTCSRSGSSWG